MMRSDVGRNFISTINAKVRRSYTESKLELQAMNEEDREEKELPPTEEEMQEIVERGLSSVAKFMSSERERERERGRLTGEFMRRFASSRRVAAANPGMTMVRRRRRVRFLARARAEP